MMKIKVPDLLPKSSLRIELSVAIGDKIWGGDRSQTKAQGPTTVESSKSLRFVLGFVCKDVTRALSDAT